MDSGGFLCFHYPCCCGTTICACLLYTADVYTLRGAGGRGKESEDEAHLGAVREDFAIATHGCDGQRGCEIPTAPRL